MTRQLTYVAALVLIASAGALAARPPQQGQPTAGRANTPDVTGAADTDEDGQPTRLPPLPNGMTLGDIRAGDSLFRGKGGCVACHGQEATGMPNSGSSLTTGNTPREGAFNNSTALTSVTRPPPGARGGGVARRSAGGSGRSRAHAGA